MLRKDAQVESDRKEKTMRRILLFGKLNDVVKDINLALSEHFYIQICELRSETAEGMLQVVNPELVIISLVGAAEYDKRIFRILSTKYERVPVITVGTKQEKEEFLQYYTGNQFTHLTRPIENSDILEAVCGRLGIVLRKEDDSLIIKEIFQKKTVLVVDDDPITLRSLREMLKEDYNIAVATSGMQAMTAIGKQRPDLILLDYEMPVCNGRQTLEMIRADEDYQSIPVIFLTGISDKAHIQAVVNLKPQGYLLKPPTRDTLMAAIGKWI